ncbi:hypothetical protein KUCAC02_022041 [Chaenocephalus aceratus]|nr:hypothetical protein KUCAC02_022041 [Chaenocephalus aceratus]
MAGLIAMVIFYLLVLGTGIWASFKSKREQKRSAATGMNMALLGNRSISLVVGIFTMTVEFLHKQPKKSLVKYELQYEECEFDKWLK